MLSLASRPRQGGITLVESLIAVLVLSLGVSALAWTQARQLADGRNTAARATAVLLIQDLGDRMLLNRSAVAAGHYRLTWGERPEAANCRDAVCSGAVLAQADLSSWRAALAQTLPAGDANVFLAGDNTRKIGVAISWNFGTFADPARQEPQSISASSHGVDCPVDRNCHVTYVPF